MLKRFPTPVYLDYAATTPVDPHVAEVMAGCLTQDGVFANPSSEHHAPGRAAAAIVADARREIAELIGTTSERIIFTSGATESDNLALTGTARYRRHEGRHIVSSRTEHKAVVDALRALGREGFEVSWLTPDADGRLSVDAVQSGLREDTVLVSVMLVNNELGVIQPVAEIGRLCRERDISFHVDAAQAVGKLTLDVDTLNADLIAFTAHKMYGPKGIGALYVGAEFAPRIEPLLYGGGQERGLRPGTLAVHQIAGFGAAARLAAELMPDDAAHCEGLRCKLIEGLSRVEGVLFNGNIELSVPGIVNVSVEGVHGESLMYAMAPFALSSGSACNSVSREPSYVLRAIGRSAALAEASLRFSFGRFTKAEDIDAVLRQFGHAVEYLRHTAVA